jgi:hypothetical protein
MQNSDVDSNLQSPQIRRLPVSTPKLSFALFIAMAQEERNPVGVQSFTLDQVPLQIPHSELGGGERQPGLQHVDGGAHTDHSQHAQYLRA